MNLPAAILLGIIQGLTEFLPISSSAHLILARAFFGWEMPPEFGLAFDVALHLGTLMAIVAFFREDILAMLRALPQSLRRDPPLAGRLLQLIAIGTIPLVPIGLAMTDRVEEALRQPWVAAWTLAIGALAMLAAERLGPRTRTETSLGALDAVLIGLAQAAALVPGVSRSGATITLAMFLGVRRDAAARFTFLLAIPAILAAAGKESLELAGMRLAPNAPALFAVGLLVSALVGYVTVKYLLRYLARHPLDVFAYYRLALTAATLVWLWRR